MQALETLEPYYIKTYDEHIHIVLEKEHFTLRIDNEEYKFHSVIADEIIINRKTQQIENLEDTVAFKKDEKVKYFKIGKLIYIPKFLNELSYIAEPYYIYEHQECNEQIESESDQLLKKLEKDNVKRLIDKALDDRNEKEFYALLKLL
ncbi:IDEAL domain-containing protein [Virgibacillus sp. W0430]|uniref:IDEAL domain-containing protein n=1 Tax=Virgibacillus sp. W0430 TaxID=3391580 RepID=UPI003F451F80